MKEAYLIRKINNNIYPQLVATEKAQKGQVVRKFLKAFYNTPSLIQGNSEYLAQPKINSIYKLFTGILTGEYDI